MTNKTRRLIAHGIWVTPTVVAVTLPAHAQTSGESPTVSDISCSFDTPTIQVGSVITIEATISDADSPLSEINWILSTSGDDVFLLAGQGQFGTQNYLVNSQNVGVFDLNLIVFDAELNETLTPLCTFNVP
jgi:hypothetical protein